MNDFWSVQADFVHVEVRSRIRIRDRPGPRLPLGRKRFTASASSGTVATFPVGSQNREAGGPIPTAHRDLTGRGIRPGPSTVAGRVWRPATASFSTVPAASAPPRRFSWRPPGGPPPPPVPPGEWPVPGLLPGWRGRQRIGSGGPDGQIGNDCGFGAEPPGDPDAVPRRRVGPARSDAGSKHHLSLARGQSILGASPSS